MKMRAMVLLLTRAFCSVFMLFIFLNGTVYGQSKALKPLLPHFNGLTKQSLKVKRESYRVVSEFSYGGKKYRAYYNSDTILEAVALRMDLSQCPKVIKEEVDCSVKWATIQDWMSVTSYNSKGGVTGKSFRVRIDATEKYLAEIYYDLKLKRTQTDLIEKEAAVTVSSNTYQGKGAGSSGPERINKWYAGSSLALKDSIVSHIKLDSTTCVKRFAGPQYTYWVKVDVNGKILDFDQASINISGYAPLVLTEGLHSYLSRIVFPKQPYGSVFQYEVKVVLQSNGSISVEIPDYKRNY